jgi:hypothetical protein
MSFWLLVFALLAVLLAGQILRSRAKKSMHCPSCGKPTRYMKPYFMCDTCESMVGVRIAETNYFGSFCA